MAEFNFDQIFQQMMGEAQKSGQTTQDPDFDAKMGLFDAMQKGGEETPRPTSPTPQQTVDPNSPFTDGAGMRMNGLKLFKDMSGQASIGGLQSLMNPPVAKTQQRPAPMTTPGYDSYLKSLMG